ncbi:restriction endonuclease subunit S [Dickeya chrysanthemi]|uniref:restriction endonuclease subunit S n=1 Tax=Dickeya chrysanthemi TaxID=556 RepID=UPI0025A0E56E|nr:restriction endonuclease subunit S [Dickeya chrysanthemi]WJM87423.1 restriction endonuclease subunit S [Dickeya chrysanthemi]
MSEFSDEVLQYYPFAEIPPPKNWERVTLIEVSFDISPGFASGKHNSDGAGIPHLRPMNVDRDGQIDLGIVKSVADSNGIELNAGDILFNNTNSAELVGKTAVVSRQEDGFAFSNHMTRVRPSTGIEPSFLARQLHFLWMTGYMRHRCTNHVNQASISSKVLANTIPILLPPSNEQTRIVTKLEELLTDLNAGVAELKTAQKKLAQYRQSLLKAAVEGVLTAQWREDNPATESGAQLLERILLERRARWEAKQLAKFAGQGKKPPKDWQNKYPEPVQPDTTDLPQLPEGWVWASLDMLGEIASGVAKGSKRANNVAVREVPYMRVANVQRGYLDLSEVKTILATEQDITELALQDGDVLFNEGGDRDKLGRGWVWRDQISECIHQNHVFRMRPYIADMQSELISHHGNTFGKLWFQKAGKQTTNLASINMTMLRMFPVPVAPATEQQEIMEQILVQIESLYSQENSIELALKQSSAQRQNILRAAFAGQLVPQDLNDEPASVLLERIRAQRAEQAKQPKPRKTKKKESSTVARKLVDVLIEAGDWLPAQEAFRRCGIADGAQTEEIEALYAELRALDKSQHLSVKAVFDLVDTPEGKKHHKVADHLKWVG